MENTYIYPVDLKEIDRCIGSYFAAHPEIFKNKYLPNSEYHGDSYIVLASRLKPTGTRFEDSTKYFKFTSDQFWKLNNLSATPIQTFAIEDLTQMNRLHRVKNDIEANRIESMIIVNKKTVIFRFYRDDKLVIEITFKHGHPNTRNTRKTKKVNRDCQDKNSFLYSKFDGNDEYNDNDQRKQR